MTKAKEFIDKVEVYFHLRKNDFGSEEQKILWATGFFEGTAHTWWEGVKHCVLPDPSRMAVWTEFSDFSKNFLRNFSNKNDQAQAKREIELKYQKEKEKIADYVAEIRALNLQARLPVDRVWEHMVGSVRKDVRDHLKRVQPHLLQHPPAGEELVYEAIRAVGQWVEDEAVKEVIIQNQQCIREQLSGGWKDKTNQHQSKPASSVDESAKISKRQQKKQRKASKSTGGDKTPPASEPKFNDIPQALRDARKKAGLCMKCGKTNHVLKECHGKVDKTTWPKNSEKKDDAGKKEDGTKKVKSVVKRSEPPIQFGKILLDADTDLEIEE